MNTITLDQALDTIMQLPLEQQEMLIEIWYKRRIEARRQEIAQDAHASIAAYRDNQYTPQPVGKIIAELRSTLDFSSDIEDEE